MVYIIGESDGRVEDSGSDEGQAKDETTGSLSANQDRHDVFSDPLADQSFVRTRSGDFSDEELASFLDTSWLKDRLVDDYAQYATKEGADIEVLLKDGADLENPDKAKQKIQKSIDEFIQEHDLFAVFDQLIRKERGTGIGVIYPVIEEAAENATFDDPISKVTKIEDLNVFGDFHINQLIEDDDPLSESFRQLGWIDVERFGDARIHSPTKSLDRLHRSRFIHLCTRWSESEPREPLSVFRRIRTLITTMMNAEWATGQIIFRSVWKVLKTDLSQFDSFQQKNMKERELERDWDPLSLSIIDTEDEMTMESAAKNIGGMGEIFEFTKDLLSAATGYPKSLLFGAQSGTVSASDRDAKNFFQGIEGFQRSDLEPVLKEVIEFAWGVKHGGVNSAGVPFDAVEIEVEWNDIFEIGDLSQAQVEKTEAQAKFQTANMFRNLLSLNLVKEKDAFKALKEAGIVNKDAELPEADIGSIFGTPAESGSGEEAEEPGEGEAGSLAEMLTGQNGGEEEPL